MPGPRANARAVAKAMQGSRPLRIVVVVASFPPEPTPSAIMVSELARNWSTNGHAVKVICSFPNRPLGIIYQGYKRRLWKSARVDGIDVIRVWSWFIGSKRWAADRMLENLSFGLSSSLALLFQRKPDIVIMDSWPIFAQFLLAVVGRIRRIATLNYIQDLYPEAMATAGLLDMNSARAGLLRRVHDRICALASATVVISERMKETVSATRPRAAGKIHVIHNWLDLQNIRPFEGENRWRADSGISEDETVFMYAGTLGFASGVDILVRVAEDLRDRKGIRIVCVGEGPLKNLMLSEKAARKLENLTILGFQPRERISEMQSAADVMLLITSPRMGESSVPSKMITYLAVGKPVLCAVADTSDIAHLVRSNAIGMVVPPGDHARIADGIIRFAGLSHDELSRIGAKAREVAVLTYSLPRALGDFRDLFDHVLGAHRVKR
jgi:colanic acid biosynthesis glycosyl transferase WcaI